MVDILALISSILFTPAFSISYFYETGVAKEQAKENIFRGLTATNEQNCPPKSSTNSLRSIGYGKRSKEGLPWKRGQPFVCTGI